MNEVGGSDSGRGLRAAKTSRSSDTNFEYDDEWDVGIGNLISDLDADIEKTNEATKSTTSTNNSLQQSLNRNLVSSSNSSSSSSTPQMHIPQSPSSTSTNSNNSSSKNKSSVTSSSSSSHTTSIVGQAPTHSHTNSSSSLSTSVGKTSSESHSSGTSVSLSVSMEHTTMSDKGLKMKIKRSKPGTKSVDAKHEIVKSDVVSSHVSSTLTSSNNSSKSTSSNNSSDLKSSASNLSTQKDTKESISNPRSEKETNITDGIPNSDEQNSSKVKNSKRTSSTHKKVRLATGVTASIVSTKKEFNSSDSKSSSSSVTTTNSSSTGNITSITTSVGKDPYNSNSTISISGIGSSSAFVKTSSSSNNMKLASQGSLIASELASGGSTTNCRSLHNSTSHNSSTSHHSITSSPAKIDKSGSGMSSTPSVQNNNNTFSEKGSNINTSHGKKPRVTNYLTTEKNACQDVPNLHGSSVGSSSYRQLNTFNTGSSDVNTGSGSTSNPQTGFPVIGMGSSTNTTKESSSGMSSRVQLPISQLNFQDACVGTTVGTNTEPDCLGPCEPGTSVTLEGIVWHETESGVLVVNVTWRGKTYVGTLLDCTKNDWASPRFCDSPTSDLEMRTPKNRGKRGRTQTSTPVSEPNVIDGPKSSSTKLRNGAKGRRGSASATAFVAPVSPMKPEQWPKRKTRGSETEGQEDVSTNKSAKRPKLNKDSNGRQSGSPAPENSRDGPYSPALIECPEPNCSKKYKHINGLRYHQSHAHSNNFAAEDSDSNMSTASNTNLNIVNDTVGISEDGPVDSRIDVDAIEGSGAESNSAPTTPVKKQGIKSEPEECEKIDDIAVEPRENDLKNSSSKLLTCHLKTPDKEESERLPEKTESPGNKEKDAPQIAGLSPRTPILTVPTLPFMSLQNRNQIHTSLHRSGGVSEHTEKSNRDQQETKTGSNSHTGNVNVQTSKGIPWQPHAFHTVQGNTSMPVTLNVPMGSTLSGREHDKSSKESKSSSSTSSGSSSKKPKHKKKSKDKSDKDRERDRKGKGTTDYNRDTSKLGLFSPTSGNSMTVKEKESERNPMRDISPPRESENIQTTTVGEGREDPQSPAYSDISDANDSGPETDLNKEQNISTDIKKEGNSSGQGISSFYSPFYTPIDSPFIGSSNPSTQVKSERNLNPNSSSGTTAGPPTSEDPGSEKMKLKTLSGHADERRSSPKMDFHHPKYLPSQQHYFSYPYPNYHYDQPYSLLSENSFGSHSRSIIEEKEREAEDQRVRGNTKCRDPIKEESAPTNLSSSSVTIKQEPGLERSTPKEYTHRSSFGIEQKSPHPSEVKSEFVNEYSEQKRSSSSGMSFYSSLSKHSSKELRREREERHSSSKETESKEPGKVSRSSSGELPCRSKDERTDKDSKNEGAKPTMETQGPPPPPTAGSYAYYPPGYLSGTPYSIPFDPNHHIFRQVMVPGPYPGSPYMHPRFSQPSTSTPLPEDLSRPNPSAPAKALDLLQQHAAQYYASHKIHELQERALKSPSPQVASSREGNSSNIPGPTNLSTTPTSPSSNVAPPGRGNITTGTSSTDRKLPTDLTKDAKTSLNPLSSSASGTENSRSPPIHHVHTHHHSHTHIGYPIIPTVPPQYSPNLTHYGVLTTPTSAPPTSVIPPFPSQKPS